MRSPASWGAACERGRAHRGLPRRPWAVAGLRRHRRRGDVPEPGAGRAAGPDLQLHAPRAGLRHGCRRLCAHRWPPGHRQRDHRPRRPECAQWRVRRLHRFHPDAGALRPGQAGHRLGTHAGGGPAPTGRPGDPDHGHRRPRRQARLGHRLARRAGPRPARSAGPGHPRPPRAGVAGRAHRPAVLHRALRLHRAGRARAAQPAPLRRPRFRPCCRPAAATCSAS